MLGSLDSYSQEDEEVGRKEELLHVLKQQVHSFSKVPSVTRCVSESQLMPG